MKASLLSGLSSRVAPRLAVALVALCCIRCLQAQTTYYWDANGTTTGSGNTTLAGTWGGASASAFWGTSATGTSATTVAAVTSADTVVFSANDGSGTANNYNGSYTVTLGAAQSVYGLVIAGASVGSGNTGGTLTLAGTGAPGLTIGAGGVTLNGSNGDPTFASSIGTITLSASQGWTINNGHVWSVQAGIAAGNSAVTLTLNDSSNTYTPTYSGVVSDGSSGGQLSLTINNGNAAALQYVSGTANTYTGVTSIVSGRLQIASVANAGSASSLGAATGSNSTIQMGSGTNSTTLVYNSNSNTTSNRSINLAGTTGNTTLNNNQTTGNTGSFSLTGGVTNGGGGNKTLTLIGNTTAAASTLGAISDATDGSKTAVYQSSGQWILSGNNTFTGGLTLTGGSLTLSGAVNYFDGAISIQNAGTTLTLNSADNFTQGMTIGGGTVIVGAAGALGANTNTITVAGGNLQFNANSGFTGNINITSGGIGIGAGGVMPTNYTDNTANGFVLGLNFADTANTAGITALNGKTSLGSFSSGAFYGTSLGAGTGNIYRLGGGGGTITIVNNVLVGNNSLIVGSTGAASGAASSGLGTVVLSSANTYTGTTTIQDGVLSVSSINSVGDNSSSSSLGADPGTVQNGTIAMGYSTNSVGLNYSGAAATTNRVLNFVGSGGNVTLSNSGTGAITYSSPVTFTGGSVNLILGNTGDTYGGTVGGIVNGSSGTTSVTKQGLTNSTWMLNGTTSYSGNTTITGGVLSVASSGVGDPLANSYLVLNGGGATTYAVLQGNGTINRTLSGTAAAGNLSWSNGGFSAYGGTLTVTVTDPTNGNNLAWGVDNFLGSGGNALVFGSTTSNAQVVFTDNVNLNTTDTFARTIDVEKGTGGDSALMSGVISATTNGQVGGTTAPSGLTKTGGGTLIFGGANTYTGITTVSAGALLLNGNESAQTGNINVSSGATLGGSGVVGGATTLAAGSFLRPGATLGGVGVLTFNNNVTFATGSTMTLQINGATTQGTDYSAIYVAFGQSLSGTGSLVLNLGAFLNGGSTLDLFSTDAQGRTGLSTVSGAFTSVTLTGAYSGSLTDSSGVWGNTINGQTFALDDTTGILTVTGSAIPEPATYAALVGALALAAAAFLRRRRRVAA